MNEMDIQAPWVGVLMDVASLRVVLEESASKEGLRWYGDGKRDDLQDGDRHAAALAQVFRQYVAQPDSWTRLMAYVANTTLFSADEKELRANLIKLSALCVSWVEDIDRRALPGYKKGKHG